MRRGEKSMSGMKASEGLVWGGSVGDVADGAMLLVAGSTARVEWTRSLGRGRRNAVRWVAVGEILGFHNVQ